MGERRHHVQIDWLGLAVSVTREQVRVMAGMKPISRALLAALEDANPGLDYSTIRVLATKEVRSLAAGDAQAVARIRAQARLELRPPPAVVPSVARPSRRAGERAGPGADRGNDQPGTGRQTGTRWSGVAPSVAKLRRSE